MKRTIITWRVDDVDILVKIHEKLKRFLESDVQLQPPMLVKIETELDVGLKKGMTYP